MDSDYYINRLINNKTDLIVILGPTASGKTKFSTQLAYKLNGEIISADSRQVYRKLNIGTGKDLNEYIIDNNKIDYHLIDILEPMEEYNLARFQQDFNSAFLKIIKNDKKPILCGGTGLYIKAILKNFSIPNVSPNKKLRTELNKLTLDQLIVHLNNIDAYTDKLIPLDTKRRVIRLIEIAMNKSNINNKPITKNFKSPFVLGIKYPRHILRKKITDRLNYRINNGMIEEVESLISNGNITHNRLNSLGLEYRYISQFLRGEFNKNQMLVKLNTAIHQFAKKQMTFYRNMEKNGIEINWISIDDINNIFNLLNIPQN